jgi:hypothetical protein
LILRKGIKIVANYKTGTKRTSKKYAPKIQLENIEGEEFSNTKPESNDLEENLQESIEAPDIVENAELTENFESETISVEESIEKSQEIVEPEIVAESVDEVQVVVFESAIKKRAKLNKGYVGSWCDNPYRIDEPGKA